MWHATAWLLRRRVFDQLFWMTSMIARATGSGFSCGMKW
jgi:hypothetical protein